MDGTKIWASFIIALIIVGAVAWYVGDYYGYQRGTTSPPPPTLFQDISDKGKIIVGTAADYPPYEFINATTTKIEGFDIDVVNAMVAKLNEMEGTSITVEWKNMDFDALIGALKTGTIDMIAAATMLTEERIPEMEYTIPYYHPNEAMLVRSDSNINLTKIEDVATLGLKVGVQTATTEWEDMDALVKAGNMSSSNLITEPKAYTLITELVSGTIDVVYIDEPPARMYAQTNPIKVALVVSAEPDVFYFPRGATTLRDKANAAFVALQVDGTLSTLIAKWFAPTT